MDISPEMIEFCRSRHLTVGSDDVSQQLSFVVADAGNPETMKPEWQSRFDLLTSFTAMHWVPDQISVLKNIDTVLGGDSLALLLIPVKAPKAFIGGGYKNWA